MRFQGEEMTPREMALQRHEKEMLELEIKHSEKLKEQDIELAKLEAKWNSWLKIPTTIIKLPIYFIIGLSCIVYAIRGVDPSEDFWNFIKR